MSFVSFYRISAPNGGYVWPQTAPAADKNEARIVLTACVFNNILAETVKMPVFIDILAWRKTEITSSFVFNNIARLWCIFLFPLSGRTRAVAKS